MEIPKIMGEHTQKEPLNEQTGFVETKYRWVVVGLTSLALLLNGMANNAVTPLEHKMTTIYDVS
jgi:hypothetical protein